jgi:hypothetical protein
VRLGQIERVITLRVGYCGELEVRIYVEDGKRNMWLCSLLIIVFKKIQDMHKTDLHIYCNVRLRVIFTHI